MGIKSNFNIGDVERDVEQRLERMKLAIVNTLRYVGEKCVNTARSLPSPNVAASFPDYPSKPIPPHTPNYIDWTKNLRSSIGYVVTVDGEIVQQSSFQAVDGGEEGARRGREFAAEIALKYPAGITLIIVAGMHYAAYVASKSYDVLNSAVIEAEELAPRLLKQLEEQW